MTTSTLHAVLDRVRKSGLVARPVLERLIDIAVQKRVFTLIATAVFIAFGIHTFTKLKIEAFPDVTNVQVMVIGIFPGQAADFPDGIEECGTDALRFALVSYTAQVGAGEGGRQGGTWHAGA